MCVCFVFLGRGRVNKARYEKSIMVRLYVLNDEATRNARKITYMYINSSSGWCVRCEMCDVCDE